MDHMNFTPMFVITSGADPQYVQSYSALFSMSPPAKQIKSMTREVFDQMTLDLENFTKINEFLGDLGMQEVIQSRKDSLDAYNNETFEIMKNYTFLCLKCMQSSPLIKNKHG